MMDRSEYMGRSKKRALEYIDAGETKNGIMSMLSDMGKHEELAPLAQALFIPMLETVNDNEAARKFIEDFRE
jgi:hypothetical protein